MPSLEQVLRALARVVLAGEWTAGAIVARLQTAVRAERRPRWFGTLAGRIVRAFPERPPRSDALLALLRGDARLRAALAAHRDLFSQYPDVDALSLPSAGMTPARDWPVPALATPGDLAAWLRITPGQLDWFADVQGRERKTTETALRHYRYRWIGKRGGGLRLLEMPKDRLKALQRRIVDHILHAVPPHNAAHAFFPGRSLPGYLAPHVGRDVVLHIDLRNFFPSVTAARVHAIFHTIRHPEPVARQLTGLCTNSLPAGILDEAADRVSLDRRRELENVYRQQHLPQGAPTSPALANLAAFRLDCRLAGLARKAGAAYTRYADDLVFSGERDFRRSLPRFRVFVCAVAIDEGFSIRARKTRVMPRGGRQRVAGINLNQHLNTDRCDYESLKATLFNCGRTGPAAQNRDDHPHFREHLQGRIAWMRTINPRRAVRLQVLFDHIDWSEQGVGAQGS